MVPKICTMVPKIGTTVENHLLHGAENLHHSAENLYHGVENMHHGLSVGSAWQGLWTSPVCHCTSTFLEMILLVDHG